MRCVPHYYRCAVSGMSHWNVRHATFIPVTWRHVFTYHTYEWGHITHINESCPTLLQVCGADSEHATSHRSTSPSPRGRALGWAMSHTWKSHVTHVNESRHTYIWVVSHVAIGLGEVLLWEVRRLTRSNRSYHTYEWVMPHIWMSPVLEVLLQVLETVRSGELCHTYEWVTSRI